MIILHWPKACRKYWKWLSTSCVKWRNYRVKWRDHGVKSWWASLQWVSSDMVLAWLCCQWEHSLFWNGSLRDYVWEQLSKYVKQEPIHKQNMTGTFIVICLAYWLFQGLFIWKTRASYWERRLKSLVFDG